MLGLAAVLAAAHGALASDRPSSNAWVVAVDAPGEANGYSSEHGAFVFEGAPLRSVVAAAWGAPERDVVFAEGIDGERLVAAYARPALAGQEHPFSRAQAQLRVQLRKTLGLHGRIVKQEGPVFVLRRIESSWQLAPSKATDTELEVRRGLFRATGAPIAALVRFVDGQSEKPVVDETGMEGRYDFVLEWDPRADASAFLDAFGDIGLALDEAVRAHPVVSVERHAPQSGHDAETSP